MNCVVLLTTEAEYMALSEVHEGIELHCSATTDNEH